MLFKTSKKILPGDFWLPTVQDILKKIKAGEAESEDTILDLAITTRDVIPKVTIL